MSGRSFTAFAIEVPFENPAATSIALLESKSTSCAVPQSSAVVGAPSAVQSDANDGVFNDANVPFGET